MYYGVSNPGETFTKINVAIDFLVIFGGDLTCEEIQKV